MAMKWRCWWCAYILPLWCYFLCSFYPTTCLQNETDGLALMSFKHSIQTDPFQVFNSWNDSLHYCSWQGVSCSRRHPERVVALDLRSRGLMGSLSPHLGNLSFLRRIQLQHNGFHSPIPEEIGRLRRLQVLSLHNNSFEGDIPTNLSHCSNLVNLVLAYNNLVGSIPVELGSLSKLQMLDLSYNHLTGSIPFSLGNLSSLQVFAMRTNELQGQIPKQLSKFQSLNYFLLQENKFTGEIPCGLFNISTMEFFHVFSNRLNGSIPSGIGLTLPNIKSLLFAFNSFTGPIPVTLSNASMLQQIVFEVNNFTGLIPKDLGKLSDLRRLVFSLNQFDGDPSFIISLTNCSSLKSFSAAYCSLRGPIPTSIANLSINIMGTQLQGNQLWGAFPIGIGNLINLEILELGSNRLTGFIPKNFGKLQKLRHLILHMNKLSGTIPPSIGNLSMLTNLDLSFNNLNGSIPPSLGTCHYLIELDLYHNNLTGSIPVQLISLSSLSIMLDLASNALTGPIPTQVGLLQNLAFLGLADNVLSGTIPKTIGKCLNLEEIYLQGNSFDGEIPLDFSTLQGLQVLDVSRNNFSGQIPSSLALLRGLSYLNISFNQLDGEVPEKGIFLNASAVSLDGNSGLCGGIQELKLPLCLSTKSKRNNRSLALKVIIPVVVVAALLALLVCIFIFYYQKRMSRKKDLPSPSLLEKQFLRVSYGELFKATNGFSVANLIGAGSYGFVYKGILEQSGGIQVAVKVLNLNQRGASSSFTSECQALRSIRHRNLLKLLSVCSGIDFQGNDFKALIYEFMAKGSLEEWLHNSEESRYLKLSHGLNIASAIQYLHSGFSSTIIHGDLKPSNVLLDEEMTAHIGDFGLAKIVSKFSSEVQQISSNSAAIKGTIGYVAPEYGMGDLVSIEGDVYSYGILLLEMFTGKKPTDEMFTDRLNLHTYVETCIPDRVMEIVDPGIVLEEEGRRFKDLIICTLRIGIACSMEQPRERMKMQDAISELQRIKGDADTRAKKFLMNRGS